MGSSTGSGIAPFFAASDARIASNKAAVSAKTDAQKAQIQADMDAAKANAGTMVNDRQASVNARSDSGSYRFDVSRTSDGA
eukprot:9469822-Pyramimonas_sp.AAC.1